MVCRIAVKVLKIHDLNNKWQIICYREFRQFTNPARADGLVLRHWVKSNDKEDGRCKLECVINYKHLTNTYSKQTTISPSSTKLSMLQITRMKSTRNTWQVDIGIA
jgi:hypothetical protein